MKLVIAFGTISSLLAVASLFLIAGCSGTAGSSAAQSDVRSGLTVRVLLYSGRPDPEYTLDPVEDALALEELRRLINEATEELSAKSETVIPSILGYRGVLIQNPQGAGGLPAHLAAYRGAIEVGNEEMTFLVDDGRKLEAFLLRLAVEKNVVDGRLLEAEKIPS